MELELTEPALTDAEIRMMARAYVDACVLYRDALGPLGYLAGMTNDWLVGNGPKPIPFPPSLVRSLLTFLHGMEGGFVSYADLDRFERFGKEPQP